MAFLFNDSLARSHHTKEEHETIGAFHGRHRVHEVLSIDVIMSPWFGSKMFSDFDALCLNFFDFFTLAVLSPRHPRSRWQPHPF